MIGNLTGQQILLIIIGIIVIIWLISWLMTKNKPIPVQQVIREPMQMTSQQSGVVQSGIGQPNLPQQVTIPIGSELLQETPFTLYYFYRPTCGYCNQFESVWKEVSNGLKNMNGISVRAVDSTKPENENITFYYNITTVPTIILVTPDKNIEYTGDRSANDLYNFVISHTKEYYQNNQQMPNNEFSINNQYTPNNQFSQTH